MVSASRKVKSLPNAFGSQEFSITCQNSVMPDWYPILTLHLQWYIHCRSCEWFSSDCELVHMAYEAQAKILCRLVLLTPRRVPAYFALTATGIASLHTISSLPVYGNIILWCSGPFLLCVRSFIIAGLLISYGAVERKCAKYLGQPSIPQPPELPKSTLWPILQRHNITLTLIRSERSKPLPWQHRWTSRLWSMGRLSGGRRCRSRSSWERFGIPWNTRPIDDPCPSRKRYTSAFEIIRWRGFFQVDVWRNGSRGNWDGAYAARVRSASWVHKGDALSLYE